MALQAASVVPRPEDRAATWLDGAVAPRAEARGLLALVRTDAASIEAVRELIGISPRIENALHRYMQAHPEDARGIEKVLRFRERVREEFERLVESHLTISAADRAFGRSIERDPR